MLRLSPLTSSGFAPFGQALRAGPSRVALPGATEPGGLPGRPVLSVIEHQPVTADTPLRQLERHPQTSQTFLPLECGRWLVASAPDDATGGPDLARLQAFLAGPGDMICIRRGLWHAPMMVFDRPASMAMLMWRCEAGPAADTEMFDLPVPLALALPCPALKD